MAAYRVSEASRKDVPQIADMSTKFAIAYDAPTTILSREPSGEFSISVESCRDVALHNYTEGILESIGFVARSRVLKSYNFITPNVIEASAWIQYFHPDPYWHVSWKDQPGTIGIPPDGVDAELYHFIENALHTDRKLYMKGREHYCASSNPPLIYKAMDADLAWKTYDD